MNNFIKRTEPCPYCGNTMFFYEEVKTNNSIVPICTECGRRLPAVKQVTADNWKRMVKDRDAFTCQRCGKMGNTHKVDAHHLLPTWYTAGTLLEYKATDLTNGIVLCKECHNLLHGRGGTIKEA